ncbi:MAG: DUF4179 domain-containing protein [Lachnospiraceae bacterium]|nr:DUF4179 domain-containing protein [Lachnospiraceae bacterium]
MNEFENMINGLKDAKVPEKVWNAYKDTLENLPEKNTDTGTHHRQWNKLTKAAAVSIIAFGLLGTTTYAAGKYLGLLDFFHHTSTKVPEEALELVTSDINQEEQLVTESNAANYTVKEALCDSERIYMVVEVQAKEAGKYFFIPEDALLEDTVSQWGIDSTLSVAEYAESKGLAPLHVNVNIQNSDELGIAVVTMDCLSVSDDVMDIMLECGKTLDAKTLDVVCIGTTWEDGAAQMEDIMRSQIQFTLTDISNSQKVNYLPTDDVQIPGTGVKIENAEVIQTELGTYVEIYYHTANTDDFYQLEFRLKNQESGSGSGGEELEDGKYVWRIYLDKTSLDDSFTLEAYDSSEKNIYGTVELSKQ